MWIYDVATLAFLDVNDAAVAHYGYGRREFLAMTIADIHLPEDVAPLRVNLLRTGHRWARRRVATSEEGRFDHRYLSRTRLRREMGWCWRTTSRKAHGRRNCGSPRGRLAGGGASPGSELESTLASHTITWSEGLNRIMGAPSISRGRPSRASPFLRRTAGRDWKSRSACDQDGRVTVDLRWSAPTGPCWTGARPGAGPDGPS